MRLKSWAGAALAIVYGLVFAGAYFAYSQRAGQFLADLPVVLAAMPYLYFARTITSGEYSFSGDMTGHVVAAAVFCCGMAYAAGWVIETICRRLIQLVWRR